MRSVGAPTQVASNLSRLPLRLVDHGDQPCVHYLLGKAPEQVAHVDGAAVEPEHGEHVQRRVKEDLRSGILPFLEIAVVVISEPRTRADLR